MINFNRGGSGMQNPLGYFKTVVGDNYCTITALLLLLIGTCLTPIASAQKVADARSKGNVEKLTSLVIGEKVPDDFWTMEHLIYVNGDTVRQTLNDYRGKPLILDFWASWCGGCLSSIGKLGELEPMIGNQFGILLVNGRYSGDNLEKVEKSVSLLRNRGYKAQFPTVIDDTILSGLFPHMGIPYVVWITKGGTVQALTRSHFLTADVFFNLIK